MVCPIYAPCDDWGLAKIIAPRILYIHTETEDAKVTAELFDLDQARSRKQANQELCLTPEDFPIAFDQDHCLQARELLGWSVEALAFRAGVSIKAIRDFESGARQLRPVTIQALSFAFEKEALIFFPGQKPMIADNLRGATPDPSTRHDFHLVE